MAQEVIFPLRDLAREKLKSFEEWSVNREELQNVGPPEEKPASFNKQVENTGCCVRRDTPSSLHESSAGSKVWGLNEVKESKRLTHTEAESRSRGVSEVILIFLCF